MEHFHSVHYPPASTNVELLPEAGLMCSTRCVSCLFNNTVGLKEKENHELCVYVTNLELISISFRTW